MAELEKSPETTSITEQETVEVEIIPKTTVAIETSDDYAEPEFGFYTHQYADGRDGTRYRLVEMDEDGYLVPYLPDHKFFLNRELIQEYIDAHGDILDVISYDDMVYDSIKTQEEYQNEPLQDAGKIEDAAEPAEQETAEVTAEPAEQETAEVAVEPEERETAEVAVEPEEQETTMMKLCW